MFKLYPFSSNKNTALFQTVWSLDFEIRSHAIHLCLNVFHNISGKRLSRLSLKVSFFLWPEGNIFVFQRLKGYLPASRSYPLGVSLNFPPVQTEEQGPEWAWSSESISLTMRQCCWEWIPKGYFTKNVQKLTKN